MLICIHFSAAHNSLGKWQQNEMEINEENPTPFESIVLLWFTRNSSSNWIRSSIFRCRCHRSTFENVSSHQYRVVDGESWFISWFFIRKLCCPFAPSPFSVTLSLRLQYIRAQRECCSSRCHPSPESNDFIMCSTRKLCVYISNVSWQREQNVCLQCTRIGASLPGHRHYAEMLWLCAHAFGVFWLPPYQNHNELTHHITVCRGHREYRAPECVERRIDRHSLHVP